MLRPVSEVVSARFVDVVLDRVLRQHRHKSVHSVADAFTTNIKLTRRQRKSFNNNHVHCINKYFLVLSAQPLARPTAPLTVDVQLRDKPITYTILSAGPTVTQNSSSVLKQMIMLSHPWPLLTYPGNMPTLWRLPTSLQTGYRRRTPSA